MNPSIQNTSGPLKELGELQVEYRQNWRSLLAAMSLGLVALGFAIVTILLILQMEMAPPRMVADSTGMVIGRRLVCGLFVLFGLLGLALIVFSLRSLNSSVMLWTGGIVHRATGGQTVFRWEDIKDVWRIERIKDNNQQTTYQVLGLAHSNGRLIWIADSGICFPHTTISTEQFAEVSKTVEDHVCRRLLPGVLATLESGSSVEFGLITAKPDGLSLKEITVPWEKVLGVERRLPSAPVFLLQLIGCFEWAVITPEGNRLQTKLSAVPNVAVLWSLIDHVLSQRSVSGAAAPPVLPR
jgi:hypothetical protein